MATNPIQRRARQSFLIGFLIAVVIMAVVVVLLFMKISELNEDLEATQEKIPADSMIYVSMEDIKSGDKVTADSFIAKSVQTTADLSLYLRPEDFEYNEDGTPVEYTAKVDIPVDSMVISSMIVKSGEERRDDERIIECNMIILPTQLVNGNYIDIRYMLPTGEDYIVLSKKYVEETNATSIWMKMTEEEILTLNSALIDAYTTSGTKLYATLYTEPGIQEKAEPTYAVNSEILTLMATNPNILDDAKSELAKRWNADADNNGTSDYVSERNHINGYTTSGEERNDLIETGIETETSGIITSRSEYVSSLEGTGLVSSYGSEE